MWQSDDKIIDYAKIGSSGLKSENISSDKVSADVNDTIISITGSNIEDDRVLIVVVKKDEYDSSKPLYENNLVQIWETAVVDGKYDYQFKMNVDEATGDYLAVVKGEKTNESIDFSYKNPNDTYNLLNSMKGNADNADVVDKLYNNLDSFGIEAELFLNLNSDDNRNINKKIQEAFNSITDAWKPDLGDYSKWVIAIKEAATSELVRSYIKNSGDVSKTIDYVLAYETPLGIKTNSKYTKYFKDPEDATEDEKKEYAQNRKDIATSLISVVKNSADDIDFETMFEEAVLIVKMNSATSWGYADKVLMEFADDIGVDVSDYRNLKNEVKNKMMENFFMMISSLFIGFCIF